VRDASHQPTRPYIGRFAPSPTGPLHAGSLVAALASWLDARAHGGQWLIRIEDIDPPRCLPGADQTILRQLADCGLLSDGPVLYQSQRQAHYQRALDALIAQDLAYPCACTRADIAQAHARLGWHKARHGELVYPGTCRPPNGGLGGRPGRAWRLKVPLPTDQAAPWTWQDRALGPQHQNLATEVGDFVIRRADGLWAYQLAVVVDDAAQGVTDIVRGQDLADNTPRQQWLQQALGVRQPRYLHTPLVLTPDGEKLSKQHGAPALDTRVPLPLLRQAAQVLGLPQLPPATLTDWLAHAVQAWSSRWGPHNL
jgi:glutamyl-Q tRNA(Asp) synthetase